ncbi:class I SAM-dependent methyltransferase [Terriglobus albidus]|uniref:Class I SAM-dependent methyltransferase n=1 Tax=Terriglobus albidus TaxID=1592106 RepID=A0A5B9E4T1_9BACT|nr:class I SAM-dependent methyltransferase [Terriglobus albidus]QEE27303.1 class I SAM-dependent methyltransferase [Terriglobus albidus]
MLRQAIRKIPGVPQLIKLNTDFEDWWFDWRHGTDTSADRADQARKGWETDTTNHTYVPIRPKCARRVLQALPVTNPQEYTFIDVGCGKGRMLLMALEAYSFRTAIGIELRKELSDLAKLNLHNDDRARLCSATCMNVNAMDFQFPEEKLVLYLFNPFGEEVMRTFLENLDRSLESSFRDVWVIMDFPVYASIADSMPYLSFVTEGYDYRIYRSKDPQAMAVAA